MKKLAVFTLIMLAVLSTTAMFVQAQTIKTATITLAWDASDGAAGYKIYRGTESRKYDKVFDVKNVLTYKDIISADGKYYYAATAYDNAGNESDFSDEVNTVVDLTAPLKPANLKISITININVMP